MFSVILTKEKLGGWKIDQYFSFWLQTIFKVLRVPTEKLQMLQDTVPGNKIPE